MGLIYYWSKLLKKIRGASIKNSKIDNTSKVEAGTLFLNSEMGKYSFCGYDCKIINCKIGAFSSIADGVVIGGGQHPIDWVSTSPVFYSGRDSVRKKFSEFERPKDAFSVVGNDVWIGERAIVKQGVRIGDGAVIGMGAVVTKNVGPYEIWGGCPAKKLKDRFDEETRSSLIKTRWWELPDDKIKLLADSIRNPDVFIHNQMN